MTTYIKIMSAENLPDSDLTKDFTMLTLADGENFRFKKEAVFRGGASMTESVLQVQRLESPAWVTVLTYGNVYVMNADGKNIATNRTLCPLIPKLTREDILKPIMTLNNPSGKLSMDELFRQTGRTGNMYLAAIEASKKAPVIVVVKDMFMVTHLIEKFGSHADVAIMTYNRSMHNSIDWKTLKVIDGKFDKREAFIDHDVLYFSNKELFRAYEKYAPKIDVSGDTFRLIDSREEK